MTWTSPATTLPGTTERITRYARDMGLAPETQGDETVHLVTIPHAGRTLRIRIATHARCPSERSSPRPGFEAAPQRRDHAKSHGDWADALRWLASETDRALPRPVAREIARRSRALDPQAAARQDATRALSQDLLETVSRLSRIDEEQVRWSVERSRFGRMFHGEALGVAEFSVRRTPAHAQSEILERLRGLAAPGSEREVAIHLARSPRYAAADTRQAVRLARRARGCRS